MASFVKDIKNTKYHDYFLFLKKIILIYCGKCIIRSDNLACFVSFGSIIWSLFYSFCSSSCISNYKACKSCKQIYLIWFSAFWIINQYNIWHFSFKNCIHLYSLPNFPSFSFFNYSSLQIN